VAVSAATALAVREARTAGMTLIGFARPGRHVIYNRGDSGQPSEEREHE
jgi:FdhD protein